MRDTLRDKVDLALIEAYAGKDFNPNEPRNPHTGEWVSLFGGLDFGGLVDGIRRALAERPERLHHGDTATNAFFVADDGEVFPLNNLPTGRGGILVHSHSPGDKQPPNYGDLHAWFRTMEPPFNTSQGTAVLYEDGTADVLTLTDHTDPKVLRRGITSLQRTLGSTYAEVEASGLSEVEFDRRNLRAFCEKYGLAYHEQVRWQ